MNFNEPDLPQRSAEGKAALDIFYSGFNEINFYVEDEDQENLYFVILRKIFPEVEISRIFPLGGKQKIIEHANSPSNQGLDSFRAYILDKDFDDLLGAKINHPNIFYLERFCIENYLLEFEAIVEFIIESQPKKNRGDVRSFLSIDNTLKKFEQDLRPLFIIFFCTQLLGIGIKNCASPAEIYCLKNKPWEIDKNKVNNLLQQIIDEAQKIDIKPPLINPLDDYRIKITESHDNHSIVSGKFIAKMIFHYVKHHYRIGSIEFYSFLYRLAKSCNLTSLNHLGENIKDASENFRKSKDARL